jgi:DNA-binding NtrC family response regulator
MMHKRYGNKKQTKILVVDDERTIALKLAVILASHGYEVATVFSGEQALLKAAEFIPDLLISDIFIGEMNGIEAATNITAMLPRCKVLFLSGIASVYDVMSAAPERLVYSFMPKWAHPLDLLNAIAYMLPALTTTHDPAEISMGRNTHMQSSKEFKRAETELVFSEAGA